MKERTFEELMDSCLSLIPKDIDKSEGSLIYTALAPLCTELSKYYLELKNAYELSFISTSFHQYLDRIVQQFGLTRKPSTPSLRLAHFFNQSDQPSSVPLDSKFSISNLIFQVIKEDSPGVYHLQCLSSGSVGNKPFGQLSPCQYVENLFYGTLDDILIPGSEAESDEELKNRFYLKMNSPSFGGNMSDYQKLFLSLQQVCSVRIYPCFNGGGTVKAVVLYHDFEIPTPQFIQEVQQIIDPTDSSGQGRGLVPIGHRVTVAPPSPLLVDFSSSITYHPGWDSSSAKPLIQSVLDDYFLEIRKQFTTEKSLVVRISQIESRLLLLDCILDVADSTLNNFPKNLILSEDFVPIGGEILC